MHLCLFEDGRLPALFPLSRTRASYDLRLGMRTLLQTSRDAFGNPPTLLHARPRIRDVTTEENDLEAPTQLPVDADVLFVNGRFIAEEGPSLQPLHEALQAEEPRAFFTNEHNQTDERDQTTLVAAFVPDAADALPADLLRREALGPEAFGDLPETMLPDASLVSGLPALLDALVPALQRDFSARTKGFPSEGLGRSVSGRNLYEHPGADLQEGVHLVGDAQIAVASEATVRPGAVLSAEDGPVFIGEGATVMENAVVRGPAYVGPQCEVKPGAHIEKSALGYYCKVGGEVEGTVMHSLSNKAHDGFLGDAYLGRWCNLGAGTITSNLKNDYGEVSVWNGRTGAIEKSGRQFAGLFMGDHAKCGIGTCFNTGTVVDVFANLFDPQGFPPRYVPPFSWGRPQDGFSNKGFANYRLEKALRVAEAVMARRDRALTEAQRRLLKAIANEHENG